MTVSAVSMLPINLLKNILNAFARLDRGHQCFAVLLALRFCYVALVLGPTHSITNDWGRHWENGSTMLEAPTFMSGIDPKLFQLWIWLLYQLTWDTGWLMDAISGLLCASMPYVWYRAARELTSPRMAVWLGIVIAAHPSFLLIYSFFMNETLLLPMLGLACWMTLKAHRTREVWDYKVAVLCWMLTIHARMTALPLMALSVGWLMYYQPSKLRSLLWAMMMGALVTAPAALQSYRVLKAPVPFQHSAMNEIYYYSGSKVHTYLIKNAKNPGYYSWSSPSYYFNHFEPFGTFQSYRHIDLPPLTIDFAHGVADYENEVARLKALYTPYAQFNDLKENIIFLCLGTSWPDSSSDPNQGLFYLAYHLRWTWLPLIFLIVVASPFVPLRPERSFIVILTLVLLAALCFQRFGIMEGRYRKPLEPLLLLSVAVLAPGLRQRQPLAGEVVPFEFGCRYYLFPLLPGRRREAQADG